jgi:hypothetical protein
VSASLHERVRQIRSRTVIRRWEFRQRDHARGTWYRIRRLLAGSRQVFVVSDPDFDRLLSVGRTQHPVGTKLHPERRIVSATLAEATSLSSARELDVRLSSQLLGERNWVLVPFE